MFPHSHKAGRNGTGAFTLIEVVLALGIVALVLTSIMGLVPSGLESARQAISNTMEANIVATTMNDIRQLEFSKIEAQQQKGDLRLWYDDQGFEVADADKSDAIYEVKIEVLDGELPQSLDPALPNPNLKKIRLGVANNPGGVRVGLLEADYKFYSAFVARSEAKGKSPQSPSQPE